MRWTRVCTSSPRRVIVLCFFLNMLNPHNSSYHTGVEMSTGRFLADLTKCCVDFTSGRVRDWGRGLTCDEQTTHDPVEISVAVVIKYSMYTAQPTCFVFFFNVIVSERAYSLL